MTRRTHIIPAVRLAASLAAAAFVPFASQSQDAVATIAGTALTNGWKDGAAAGALFNDPTGLAMDVGGNIYVADNQNHAIRKVSPIGMVSTLAGQPGQPGSADGTGTNALFDHPSGIAIDPGGSLYVTDTGNHVIRRITTNGVVTTLAGKAGESGFSNAVGNLARFNTPLGIAVDQSGLVHVADSANHVIRKITAGGAVTTLAGSPEIWGGADGAGSAALFNCPVGIAVDNQGNAFVSDANNHAIRKISPTGMVTTWAGELGVDGSDDGNGHLARFRKPAELKLDRFDNLFVADSFNHTIRKVSTNGEVVTLAGFSGAGGAVDGLGSQARFLNPYGLAIDAYGNLRVADTYNQTIRFVYSSMQVSLARAGSGDSWIITWQSVPGNKYQVQGRDALPAGDWQNLGAVVTATNVTAALVDYEYSPRRFYQVVLVP